MPQLLLSLEGHVQEFMGKTKNPHDFLGNTITDIAGKTRFCLSGEKSFQSRESAGE